MNEKTWELSDLKNRYLSINKWIEYHDNGKQWITGHFAIVADKDKHLFDYRTGIEGYEGQYFVRIGVWTKYYDNGQLGWQLDYGDGSLDLRNRKQYPSYRKDGTVIVY